MLHSFRFVSFRFVSFLRFGPVFGTSFCFMASCKAALITDQREWKIFEKILFRVMCGREIRYSKIGKERG